MRNLPPVVRIEPAASCNLRCLHCPTGLDQTPKGLMSMETFQTALLDLREYGNEVKTVVLYHGGEPLLNQNLEFMIRAVKETQVKKVKLVSNGKLLTEEISIMLTESGLDEIEISLDSVGAAESDSIRRRSDAIETIKNTKLLVHTINKKQGNLKVAISTTQFVDDYDITQLQDLIAPVEPQWLRDEFKNLPIKVAWAIQWPGGLPREKDIVFRSLISESPTSCSLLEETITVRSNGDVVVCCYDLIGLSDMGNVAKSSLSEIWKSQAYSEFRESFKAKHYPEPCKSCAVVTGAGYLSRSQILQIQ